MAATQIGVSAPVARTGLGCFRVHGEAELRDEVGVFATTMVAPRVIDCGDTMVLCRFDFLLALNSSGGQGDVRIPGIHCR